MKVSTPIRLMKTYIYIQIFTYIVLCSKVCNAAEFILPSELAGASQAKLVIKDGGGEREIILKANSKWVMDEEKLSQYSNKTIWLIFSWDKNRHAQILQVENGDILIFAEKVGLTYQFKIRIDKFLSGLWGK